MNDSLGDRMKNNYENRYRFYLTRRTPAIIRLDGRAFHTVTRGCTKPFDVRFSLCMLDTALYLCREIQGAKCAYTQSDEISILLTDFDTLTTDAWFDYNIQKIASISSGLASAFFSKSYSNETINVFDSRVFNIPREEVCNYFIWRQKDWIRNSIAMLAQAHFSHKELQNKKQSDMHEMLHSKGINWNSLDDRWKNGQFIFKNNEGKWLISSKIIFNINRSVIESCLEVHDES